MARADFGGTSSDFLFLPTATRYIQTSAATLTLWDSQTSGTRYTDLMLNSSPVTSIPVGVDGQIPVFQGPDGITQMWADAGGGVRVLIVSLANVAAAITTAYGAVIPAAADKIVYVTNRGNDSNDGRSMKTAFLTIQAAITALGGPGVIQLGQGGISTASSLSLGQSANVTIRGMGGTTAGATPASSITYTGTGSGSFIDARSSTGFTLENVMALYSSSSFTGRLIDLRDDGTHGNTTFTTIRDCYLGGASAIRTANCLVDISNTHSLRFERTQFRSGADVGLRGKNLNTDTCNAITVKECYFNDNTTAHILNPGDGFAIEGCTFEALHSGGAGAVKCESGFTCNSVRVDGGWAGDVLAAAGGIQYDFTGNNITIETFIGGNTGSTGVKFRNVGASAPVGLTVASRFDGPTTGIDFAGVAPEGFDFSRSSFNSNVTTKLSGGVGFYTSIDVREGTQVLGLRNRSSSDGRVPLRFQGDRTSSYAYDIGMDLDGGNVKRFGIRDQTRSGTPHVWYVTAAGSVVNGGTATDLTTTATDGFTYIPTTNGTPTGVPTAITGNVPMTYDRSTNKLYVYNGGAWKSVTLT